MEKPATLEEATADVRSYLNDRSGARWDDAQVTRGLHSAVSKCVDLYGSKGGDQFTDEVSVTTSAVDGTVSLLKYDPLRIREVIASLSNDGFTWPIHECDPGVRGTVDTDSRTLTVRLISRPTMPTEKTDPLIGARDGAYRSWPAFDRWVAMRAALELATIDNDQRIALAGVEATQRQEILSTVRIPQRLPWPRERRRWLWDLRWLWLPRAATMQLRLSGIRGF